MTRFSLRRDLLNGPHTMRAAVAAGIALSMVLPLSGCGSGKSFNPLGVTNAVSRKKGTITLTVTWPERTRLIPVASNSINVIIKDSKGNPAPGFPKILVRPTDISGSPTVATTTATNLEVGPAQGSDEVYTIQADAYPNANATGVIQATATTSVGLNVVDTDKPVNFTLASTIKRVTVTITDGSLSTQNLGKGRTRTYIATAWDSLTGGNVVLTTPSKIKWDSSNAAVGGFLKSDNTTTTPLFSYTTTNSITFVAADPGLNTVSTNITATETESGVVSANEPVTVVPLGLASTPNTPWPRFHGDKGNSGLATNGPAITANPTLTANWPALASPNVVLSSAAVAKDGTVYIGAYDESSGKSGKLYAINSDGSPKWTYTAKGKIETSPIISQDGTIYFGSYDDSSSGGYLYALKDNGTGVAPSNVWAPVQTNGPVIGTLALDKDGYFYYGTGGADKKLYKRDSLNGIQVIVKPTTGSPYNWEFPASGEIVSAPALSTDEQSVYFTTADGNLYGVNTQTAKSPWASPFSTGQAIFASSPALSGSLIFFGTLEGKLYAVNAATGTSAWANPFDTGAQIYSTPTVSSDGSRVYFATFDNVTGVDENKVYALDTATGASVWSTLSFAGGFTSSPALSADGSTLYLGCYDGHIYGISATTGSELWGYPQLGADPTENFDSSPAIGKGGVIYIGSYKGKVYSLQP